MVETSVAAVARHPPLFGRAKPLLEGGIGARPFFLPLVLTLLPVCPRALGTGLTHCVKDESVEPTFALRVTEEVIVNPLKEAKGKRTGFLSMCFSMLFLRLEKARTALLKNVEYPRGRTNFRLDYGANP
jgi:hypothetical protein